MTAANGVRVTVVRRTMEKRRPDRTERRPARIRALVMRGLRKRP